MKLLKNPLHLICAILITMVMGAFFAQAFGNPEYALHIGLGLLALSLIPKSTEQAAFETVSPDLSAISKYAVTNKVKLLRRLYYGLDIANDITLQPNVKNKMPMPMLVINGQPRPYTGNHKPNASDIQYTDRELEVFDWQRDLSIDPSYYRNTYLAQFRGPGEGANNMTVPFAQFTNETFIDQNSSMLNNKVAFNGLGKSAFAAYNAGTAYTAGTGRIKFAGADSETHYYVCVANTTAGQSPVTNPEKWALSDALAITEGLGTKIKAARASNLITDVASTGIITPDDAFEQALMVYRKLKPEIRDNAKDIYLYGASNLFDMVSDSFKNDIQKYTNADGEMIVLPRTEGKCKIKRASWMAGSGMFMASQKSNLFMGTDLLSDSNDLRSIPGVYKIDTGLKGLIGFQFADEQAIALNDQN